MKSNKSQLDIFPQHKSFLWHLDIEPFTWHTFYGEQCPSFVTEENKEAWKRYLTKIIKMMQEVSFVPRDNDDFMAQLRLLERWHKKSIPQILEKNRPDAAYAIAMTLCKHIPLWQ